MLVEKSQPPARQETERGSLDVRGGALVSGPGLNG